ncbi:MAG: type 1 glutamine amidotransferase domain-containing protein [Bacteroidota bacterium]|nr:type 1 glutamine amidotransferase domain-containing protein [Bacteroidota bacterium]
MMKGIMRAAFLGIAFLLFTIGRAFSQKQETRALIVLTSTSTMIGANSRTGYRLKDAIHPYYIFLQAGFTVEFASPEGGRPPLEPGSIDSTDAWTRFFFTDTLLQGLLSRTIPSRALDPERYDIVLFAGGHGALWDFLADTNLHSLTARIFGKRGIVAAVGQGAAVLLNTKLSDGNYIYVGSRLTASSDEEEEREGVLFNLPYMLETALRRGGGIYFKAPPFTPNVIPEHRLITGQNSASALGVAKAVVETWKRLRTEK